MFVHVGWAADLIEGGGLYLPCAERLLHALRAEEVRWAGGGMDLGEWLISKSSLY